MDIPVALLAVGLGWALSELSQLRRSSAATRAALGRTLAELLEIRHYLQAMQFAFELFRKHLPIPENEREAALNLIGQLAPPDPGLPQRYSEAVSQVAEVAPVLSYRLRRKDAIPLAFVRLKSLISSQSPHPIGTEIDQLLDRESIIELDTAIKQVAWRHGLWTWLSTVLLLRKPLALPEAGARLLQSLQAAGAQQASSNGA